MRLSYLRVMLITGLLLTLFVLSVPRVSAHTVGSEGNSRGQLTVTLKNPKHSPGWAEACITSINPSRYSNIMYANVTVTCTGGAAYWVIFSTYSEHCIASIFGFCWAGWDQEQSYYPPNYECSEYNVLTLGCGTTARSTEQGKLYRWRVETCITFEPGQLNECSEDDWQEQF